MWTGAADGEDEGAEQEHAIVDAVARASAAVVEIDARSLAAVSEDVTLPQLRTLNVLGAHGAQSVSSLADNLDVHASTMTRMCNRLVGRALVVRTQSVEDRREVLVTLSGAGRELVDHVSARRRHEIDTIVHRLPDHARRTVVEALDSFVRAAALTASAPAPVPEED
jgi:DNA-binding MarR family transcriptional regulator